MTEELQPDTPEGAFTQALTRLGPLPDGQYRGVFQEAREEMHRGDKTLVLRYRLTQPWQRSGIWYTHRLSLTRKSTMFMVKEAIHQICPGEHFTFKTLVNQLNDKAGTREVIFQLKTIGKYQQAEMIGSCEAASPHEFSIFYEFEP